METLSYIWNSFFGWVSQAVNERPAGIVAGMLFALSFLLAVLASVLFMRLRALDQHQRAFVRLLDAQSAEFRKLKADIEEKLRTVAAQQESQSKTAPAERENVLENSMIVPAALLREELAAVRMDLLGGGGTHADAKNETA